MSTLRISNIEAKSVPASATVDEKVKITNSSGDPLVFIDGKTSGITTVGINTTDPNITFDANSNVVVTGVITATKFSGQFEPTSVGIADSIFHTGDTDTVIRFPAADTITAETAGSEALRINSSQKVLIGSDTIRNIGGASAQSHIQLEGLTANTSSVALINNQANTNSPVLSFGKTRGTSDGAVTTVADGDNLGSIKFCGADGTDIENSTANIKAIVNGTVAGNQIPTDLVFETSATGSSGRTEKLRIDSTGRLLAGTSSSRSTRLGTNSFSGILQIESDSEAAATIARFNNGTGSSRLVLQKGRGTMASPSVIQSGDDCGQILFSGWDGDTFTNAAQIRSEVDGTPGDDDMPGRLIFSTTTDGGTVTTERLRIDSNGKFCFGTYTNGYQNNDSLANFVNAASGGTENPLITLWNPTTVADARASIDFLTNAHSGTGRDGAFIRGSNDGVTAKAHLQFGTIKDESYVKTMELASGGDLSISDGNLVLANGHGIDFSATSDSGNGTMGNELFDDYEEGSWTPSFNTANSSGTLGSLSYDLQQGRYIKIGATVYIEGALRTTNVANNGTGTYDIAGLPFTNNSGGSGGVHGIIHCGSQLSWTNAPNTFDPIGSATYMRARGGINVGDGTYTNGLTSDFSTGSGSKNRVYFSGTYSVDF